MTIANMTGTALSAHAHELAKAFNARIIESAQLLPEEALALPHMRVALVGAIVDETTYAVALHELGHLCSPLGALHAARIAGTAPGNVTRIEEDAAWTWARHYALEWTPVMDALARWAEGTYAATRQQAQPAPAPQAPAAPSINWNDWK